MEARAPAMKSFLLAFVFFFLNACESQLGRLPTGPEPTPVPEQMAELRQSAYALDMVVQLAQRSITIPFPGGSLTLEYENGWYSAQVIMFGSERLVRIQFQDASGNSMPIYLPHDTRAIRLMTLTEDRLGLRRFDFLIRGVEVDSDTFRITGNGRLVSGNQDWDFFANNVVLAKTGNPYPLRGEAVLETEHSTSTKSGLRFRFNGSRIVEGQFVSGSVTAFFTVDLVSLEVTMIEPTP